MPPPKSLGKGKASKSVYMANLELSSDDQFKEPYNMSYTQPQYYSSASPYAPDNLTVPRVVYVANFEELANKE